MQRFWMDSWALDVGSNKLQQKDGQGVGQAHRRHWAWPLSNVKAVGQACLRRSLQCGAAAMRHGQGVNMAGRALFIDGADRPASTGGATPHACRSKPSWQDPHSGTAVCVIDDRRPVARNRACRPLCTSAAAACNGARLQGPACSTVRDERQKGGTVCHQGNERADVSYNCSGL